MDVVGQITSMGTDALVGVAGALLKRFATVENAAFVFGVMAGTWGVVEFITRFPYARGYFDDTKIGRQMKEWLAMALAALVVPFLLPDAIGLAWRILIGAGLGALTEYIHIKIRRRKKKAVAEA